MEKRTDAVECLAMDYEGIYRKPGASSQSKIIIDLFEKGDYDTFDLEDVTRFNDICSVTSVLKSYFRALLIPLLAFALPESLFGTAGTRDERAKHEVLPGLVSQLPLVHYSTLKMLMLHLFRVQERSNVNLMTAGNLAIVWGSTLMRLMDKSDEFADMASTKEAIEGFTKRSGNFPGDRTIRMAVR